MTFLVLILPRILIIITQHRLYFYLPPLVRRVVRKIKFTMWVLVLETAVEGQTVLVSFFLLVPQFLCDEQQLNEFTPHHRVVCHRSHSIPSVTHSLSCTANLLIGYPCKDLFYYKSCHCYRAELSLRNFFFFFLDGNGDGTSFLLLYSRSIYALWNAEDRIIFDPRKCTNDLLFKESTTIDEDEWW